MMSKLKYSLLFFCYLFIGHSTWAQVYDESQLIPRDVLFDLAERKELIRLLPDASTVFYVKGAYQPIPGNRVYFRNVSDLENEGSIAFSGAVGDYKVLNQNHLLVRTLTAVSQGIELYSFEDSTSTSLFKDQFKSIRWLAFSKGNRSAAFVAMPFNANPILFKYDFGTHQMDTLSNIARGHYPLFFDEALNVIAGERIDQATGDKILAYFENDQWQEIVSYKWSAERFLRPGLKSIVGASADGRTVYYTDNSTTDKTVLKAFDIYSKQSIVLVSEQNSDLMTNSYISDKNGMPIAIANHYSKRNWNVVNAKYNADFEFLKEEFNDFQILDISDDKRYWAIEEMTGGANVAYLYDSEMKVYKPLFTDHEELEKYSIVNRFSSTIQSFDSLQIPIQYYLSEKFDQDKNGIPDVKIPAVLYVHGGPWQGWMEDFWLITRHLQLLADRGYLVVYAQFRGSLTFGKEFLNAGDQQWGDGMVKDKVAIANWLAKEKNILKDKIGIFGWSYGGYAALAGAAFSPATYTCAVSLYGPTYLDAPQEENAFGYSPNSLLRIADVTTQEGKELAHQHSPLYATDRIEIPILMSTGSKDDRVPQMQMDKMAEALKRHNKDVTYFVYPEEGHDYSAKETWTSFWSIGEQFLSKHLGGMAEPKQDEDYSILEMIYKSETK